MTLPGTTDRYRVPLTAITRYRNRGRRGYLLHAEGLAGVFRSMFASKFFFYASAAIVPNIIPLFLYASHYVLSCMINYNQKIFQVNIKNNDDYARSTSRAIQYYRTNTVLIRDY